MNGENNQNNQNNFVSTLRPRLFTTKEQRSFWGTTQTPLAAAEQQLIQKAEIALNQFGIRFGDSVAYEHYVRVGNDKMTVSDAYTVTRPKQ